MIAAIEILRPINGLMALAGFVIAAALSGFPLAPVPVQLLIGALVVFLHTGAGMTLNDYFDWRIDRINRPYRVIPSGRMTTEGAMNYATALFGMAIAFSVFVLPPVMSLFVVFNTMISVLYSWKLKRTPLGHIIIGWLTASVFIFASLLVGYITLIALVLFSLVFCGNLAREIIKGIEDYRGDRSRGARTLAIALGKGTAGWTAISLAFLSIGIIPVPFIFGAVGVGYALAAAAAASVIFYSCYLTLTNEYHKAQEMLKWAMAIVIVGLIIGALV